MMEWLLGYLLVRGCGRSLHVRKHTRIEPFDRILKHTSTKAVVHILEDPRKKDVRTAVYTAQMSYYHQMISDLSA